MLRMYRQTIAAGHAAGIPVAMCGELAADPLAAMLLVGLELDEFSVSPVALPEIKKLIRSMRFSEAKLFAEKCLAAETYEELISLCTAQMKHRFADLPVWFGNSDENNVPLNHL